MQERAQALGLFGPEGEPRAVGPGGAFDQRLEPVGVEGVQRVEHRLVVDAQICGDAGGPLPAGAGQEDLTATQDEGVLGAQPVLQRVPLLLAQRANKDRWSHAHQRTTFSFTYSEQALGAFAERPLPPSASFA